MKILEELRPKVFDDIVGQQHLTSKETVFRKMVEDGGFDSLILVGPPGTGKTTIAEIICNVLSMPFFQLTRCHSRCKRSETDYGVRQTRWKDSSGVCG